MFGVALGGGGIHGLAHIGVLQVLVQAGYAPQAYAGTSAGALCAGLAAWGQTPPALAILARHVAARPGRYFRLNTSGAALELLYALTRGRAGRQGAFDGLVRATGLEELLRTVTRRARLQDVPFPLALTATDLSALRRVVFSNRPVPGRHPASERVPLATAMRASMAFPVVFTPVRLDGHLLVDGGVADDVPADLLPHLGADVGLAVVIDAPHPGPAGPIGLMGVLGGTIGYVLAANAREHMPPQFPCAVARVDLTDRPALDFGDLDLILDRGRAAAESVLPQLRELLGLRRSA